MRIGKGRIIRFGHSVIVPVLLDVDFAAVVDKWFLDHSIKLVVPEVHGLQGLRDTVSRIVTGQGITHGSYVLSAPDLVKRRIAI